MGSSERKVDTFCRSSCRVGGSRPESTPAHAMWISHQRTTTSSMKNVVAFIESSLALKRSVIVLPA